MPQPALLDLPPELLGLVLAYLDPFELTVLGQVCRSLWALARDPALLVHLDLPAIEKKHHQRLRSPASLECALYTFPYQSLVGLPDNVRHGVVRRLLARAPLLRWLRLGRWAEVDFAAQCPLLHTLDVEFPDVREYARLEVFMQSPHARHLRLRVRLSSFHGPRVFTPPRGRQRASDVMKVFPRHGRFATTKLALQRLDFSDSWELSDEVQRLFWVRGFRRTRKAVSHSILFVAVCLLPAVVTQPELAMPETDAR